MSDNGREVRGERIRIRAKAEAATESRGAARGSKEEQESRAEQCEKCLLEGLAVLGRAAVVQGTGEVFLASRSSAFNFPQ